jgi:subtilisin
MKRFPHTIFFLLALLVILTPAVMAAPPELARRVVVLHDDVESPGAIGLEIARQVGGQLGFIYEHALKGFSIMVPPQAVGALEKNPNVKYVATDDIRYAVAQVVPTGIKRIFADTNENIGIDGNDDFRVDVDVAVIDTGIDFNHPDLNVVGGINCAAGNIFRAKCIAGGDDDHSHGTHVAGTIGALDNDIGVVGVAPGARLWAVKVLNSRGSGYTSWIIAGIDWVAANAGTIKVANMSLSGSGYNQAEYDAINGAVSKGVAFAVAAGNADADACNYSPAGFDNVLTVSALADFDGDPGALGSPTCRADQDDTLADFSNWGTCIDLAAPGVCILSTVPGGGYDTFSGTSMASPHVAGALALLASSYKPTNATDVYNLYDQVKNAGNYNWTDDSGDGIDEEPLLDVSTFVPALISNGGGGENNPPTVYISSPTDGSSFDSGVEITFSGSATDSEDGDLTTDLIWTSSLDG